MSKTPRTVGPIGQKGDVIRPAGITANVEGSDAVVREGASDATNDRKNGALVRIALRFTAWAEHWFPDAFVFVAIAVVVVAAGALVNGAPVAAVTKAFGDGFWSLIPFTMQMVFVTIGGYVVATSPPAQKLIDRLVLVPKTGRGAVGFIAAVSMISSLFSWGLSLIFGGLLARAIARRTDLRMDYRAAGAAAYLGLGATWALGLSSSAAQLQANAASLPKTLLPITRPRLGRDRVCLREREHPRELPLGDGHLLGGARLLRPFGRGQVAARGTLCHAGSTLIVHLPVVLFLLWFFAKTLAYMPPVVPG